MATMSLFERVTTLTLVTCALVVSGIVVRRELNAAPTPQGLPETVPGWRELARDTRTRIGPDSAPVTITEFSDFQCPFCKVLSDRLAEVTARYPNKVRIAYRHFPLDQIHPHARKAAYASICAGDQGRFPEYHDLLFAHQDSIGTVPWTTWAVRAGITDTSQFVRCMNGPFVSGIVKLDSTAGAKIGLRGTPLMLINDRLIAGAPALEKLDSLIGAALKDTPAR
jgi:protein-disulfide isomerase